jgi:hypothetical protein
MNAQRGRRAQLSKPEESCRIPLFLIQLGGKLGVFPHAFARLQPRVVLRAAPRLVEEQVPAIRV